jgi:hypothetical protein
MLISAQKTAKHRLGARGSALAFLRIATLTHFALIAVILFAAHSHAQVPTPRPAATYSSTPALSAP